MNSSLREMDPERGPVGAIARCDRADFCGASYRAPGGRASRAEPRRLPDPRIGLSLTTCAAIVRGNADIPRLEARDVGTAIDRPRFIDLLVEAIARCP